MSKLSDWKKFSQTFDEQSSAGFKKLWIQTITNLYKKTRTLQDLHLTTLSVLSNSYSEGLIFVEVRIIKKVDSSDLNW